MMKHKTKTYICYCIASLMAIGTLHFNYSYPLKLQKITKADVNTIMVSNDLQPTYIVDPYPTEHNEVNKVKYFIPSLTDEAIKELLRSSSWEEVVKGNIQ